MTEFIVNHMWCVWLVVAVALVILELLTTALVSIWFVPGAIASALVSMFLKNITVQVIVFLVVSGAVIVFSKKVFKHTRTDQLVSPNDQLIGKIGVVKDTSSPTEYKVLVGDVYWRAVAYTSLCEGDMVKVMAVNGTTLTVEKQFATVKES